MREALINLHVLLTLGEIRGVVSSEMGHELTTQLYFKLCSDHLSIEAIPRRRLRVDFRKMKDGKIRGHELVMWTPHFVIIKNRRGQEITLRQDGRMIVRRSPSETIARESAAEMMEIVLKDFAL